MFGDREQLDVGESVLHNVIRQLAGQLAVVEPGSP